MKTRQILAIINTIAFILTITVNALANIIPLNGLNTGEVSSRYPSLFTPAGITFSIWSVIYLLLAGFIFVQWKNLSKPYYNRLSLLFVASCLLNATWILAWHYLLVSISVIIMIFLLAVLIQIFLLLQRFVFITYLEFIFVKLPFSIYLAWICVATIANVSAYLTFLGWNGPISEVAWTIIMMGIASAIAILILVKYRTYAFPAVVIWALAGIAIRGFDQVTSMAIVWIALMAVISIIFFFRGNKKLLS